MNTMPRLTLAALSTVLLLNTSLVGASATAADTGSLSVTPAVIERTAVRGDTTSLAVVNTTGQALKITVTPRPWTQSRTGAVAPNRHATLLSRLSLTTRTFTLAAGDRRTVTLRVKAVPSSGSLYGSIETIGLPTGPKKKNGITAAYRLISTLRLNPPTTKRRLAVHASTPRVSGRSIVLPVKNTGNTVSPVTGDIRIKGATGTRTDTLAAHPILPGSTVNLGLGSTKGLPSGTYSVSVTLKQGGKQVLRSTRKVRLR